MYKYIYFYFKFCMLEEIINFIWFTTFLFKKIINILFYWSIVDLQCCVNFCCTAKWFSCTYIYIYSSLYSFLLWFITGYWIYFPVLYSRILLFVHSICNSLHLLTPNFQSIPPTSRLPCGNHKSVLYVCESISVS